MSVAIHPSSKYIYVVNQGDNSVSQYSMVPPYPYTGPFYPAALSPPTIATGTNPQSITVDASGKYVYVVNSGSNTISQYTINSDGTLSANGSVVAGTNPSSIIIDHTGKYAYVANSGSNTISQYAIGPTGTLSPLAPQTVATGTNPQFDHGRFFGQVCLCSEPGRHCFAIHDRGKRHSLNQWHAGCYGSEPRVNRYCGKLLLA